MVPLIDEVSESVFDRESGRNDAQPVTGLLHHEQKSVHGHLAHLITGNVFRGESWGRNERGHEMNPRGSHALDSGRRVFRRRVLRRHRVLTLVPVLQQPYRLVTGWARERNRATAVEKVNSLA